MADYTRFKLRGDVKADWLNANPVLALNEPALETDTKRFKIGDGVSTYSALPYGRNTNEYASLYNVSMLFPLSSGFYAHTTAITSIPTAERIKGLIISYETSAGTWYTEQYTGTDVSGWDTLANWSKVPGASDFSEMETSLGEKVSKSGNESIEGVKTFSESPIIPTPTTNLQAATKGYVDAANAQVESDLSKLNKKYTNFFTGDLGYINISGSISSAENTLLSSILNITATDKLIFSGGYTGIDLSLVWGYYENGTAIPLLSAGTYIDEIIEITDPLIVKVRAWSNSITNSTPILRVVSLLDNRVDEISNVVESNNTDTLSKIKNRTIFDNDTIIPSMQLFNGATKSQSTLTIPVGSTGYNTTYQFDKLQKEGIRVHVNVHIICSHNLLNNFNIKKTIPSAVISTVKISDYEYIVESYLDYVSTATYSLYLQKLDTGIATEDIVLDTISTSYYEEPIISANNISNKFIDDVIDKRIDKKKFLYYQETVLNTTGEFFLGAIKITGGFTIPVGSTGYNTYLNQAGIEVINGKSGILQFDIDTSGVPFSFLIFKISNIVTAYTYELISGNTYRITMPITVALDIVNLTVQYKGTAILESEISITISNIVYYSKYTESTGINGTQMLIEKFVNKKVYEVSTIVEYITKTCSATGTVGVDADFVGVNCIQSAINSCTGASSKKIYIIKVKNGNYYVTNTAQYLGGVGTSMLSMILPKSYVNIEGESVNGVVLHAELPIDTADFDSNTYPRENYQTIYSYANNCTISNMTIVGKNIRYTIHIDNAAGINATHLFKNILVVFEGTLGYRECFGIGSRSGEILLYDNVKMITSSNVPFLIHNNTKFDKESMSEFNNCEMNGSPIDYMYIQNAGSMKDCKIIFNGCKLPFELKYDDLWLRANTSANQDYFDHANFGIGGNGNTPVLFTNNLNGDSLCITSISATDNSSVIFDSSSTAFLALIKDKNANIGAPVTSVGNYYKKDGCLYLEGSAGTKAKAIGCLDLSTLVASADTVNYRSMGKRLGDCTATNKILGINIDGIDYTIVFDKDYTSATNASIIAEINTVISSVATSSIYNYSKEYYHEFTDCIAFCKNGANVPIAKGSVVSLNSGVCSISDGFGSIGVALDNIPIAKSNSISARYGYGRILIKGYISSVNTSAHYILTSSSISEGDKLKVLNGIMTIDENGSIIAVKNGIIPINI